MIPPELCAKIRRLFDAEHWRVGTIASTLGVHHDTVQGAIARDRFVRTGSQIRPSLLDPYKAFITATLEHYPRLRATRLYWMLRDRGFAGSVLQVQRFARTVRPAARAEAYLRLETLVGEQGQVDWGNRGHLTSVFSGHLTSALTPISTISLPWPPSGAGAPSSCSNISAPPSSRNAPAAVSSAGWRAHGSGGSRR